MAWVHDIHHNDPSLHNFMYRTIDNKVFGVLNDWDYGTDCTQSRDDCFEVTGTIPFMALDLLDENEPARLGQITHLYRHDLEATIWILVWVSVCFFGGQRLPGRPLESWLTGRRISCRKEKMAYLFSRSREPVPSNSDTAEWAIGQALLDMLVKQHTSKIISRKDAKVEADDVAGALDEYCKTLEDSLQDVPVNAMYVKDIVLQFIKTVKL